MKLKLEIVVGCLPRDAMALNLGYGGHASPFYATLIARYVVTRVLSLVALSSRRYMHCRAQHVECAAYLVRLSHQQPCKANQYLSPQSTCRETLPLTGGHGCGMSRSLQRIPNHVADLGGRLSCWRAIKLNACSSLKRYISQHNKVQLTNVASSTQILQNFWCV